MKQFLGLFFAPIFFTTLQSQKPKIVIALVVDQCSWQEFKTALPYFHDGLKKIYDGGTVFTNCIQPHGMPSTATGHAALSTGVYAKDHGWIGNSWFDKNGKKIGCDDAPKKMAGVFDCKGNTLGYGKSAHNLLVDGLSDQLLLCSHEKSKNKVFALSLKSRSAIATAAKLGKAIWFDRQQGCFTSSKAYFQSLPEWIKRFNNKQTFTEKTVTWHLSYPQNSPAYGAVNKKTYDFSPKSYINRPVEIKNKKEGYEPFLETPFSMKLLFDLAKDCFDKNYTGEENIFFLWLTISSPDKINHQFGPASYEVIDMYYKLDKYLGTLMGHLEQKVDPCDILYVLSADHGTSPLPELVTQEGYPAHRIFYKKLIPELNALLSRQFGTKNLILEFKTPQFYLDMAQLKTIPTQKQQAIIFSIKQFLLSQPGIKRVWTFDELHYSVFEPEAIENYFKQQLLVGRSGFITVQTAPLSQFTKYKTGTSHRTPYAYNTRIPLLFYQKGTTKKQNHDKKVLSLQVPITIASILQVPQPSASTTDPLMVI